MKKMPAKKLQLSRETLRNLHEEVGKAVGGKSTTCVSAAIATCGCATDPC